MTDFKVYEKNNIKVAEIVSDNILITGTQDALDIMADLGYRGIHGIILHEKHLTPGFFDLSSRIAGDILQKCSNYRFRLAILGDFSKYKSQSLQDFIRESNKGNIAFFVTTLDEAIDIMTGK